jgi:lysophospholipase L1-like esterase
VGWRKLLTVVVTASATLLLVELTLRLYYGRYGNETDRIRYVYTQTEIRQHRARLTGAPFVVYRLTSGYPTQNALGFRGPETTVAKPKGVFRVVALGGSTTYGDQIARWEDAYPAQLEAMLRARGRHVEVINAGVPGYSSWEMLVAFEFRLLDLQPDLLIVYEGINDLYPRLVKPSQYDGMATSKGIWKTAESAMPASTLYRIIAVRRGWMADPSLSQSLFDPAFSAEFCRFNAAYTRCDNFGASPDTVLTANPPTYFERNIRSLVALALSNHVQVMLSTWAYYPAAIPDAPNGSFMTLPFVRQAVSEHNQILRSVAQAMHVPLYDLATSFPTDRSLWFEGMHLTPAGARKQAAAYADFLTARGLIP